LIIDITQSLIWIFYRSYSNTVTWNNYLGMNINFFFLRFQFKQIDDKNGNPNTS
jgi:hypothetical protein